MSTKWAFDGIENNHYVYRGKDCMKKFCESLKELESYVRGHCHYAGKYGGVAHSTCRLRYSIPQEILIAFHNGSNYEYYFTISS